MQIRKTQLDVDFIGDQSGLTTAEEKALSDYFKQRKLLQQQSVKQAKMSHKQSGKANSARA